MRSTFAVAFTLIGGLGAGSLAHAQTVQQGGMQPPVTTQAAPERNPVLGDPGARTRPMPQTSPSNAASNGPAPERAEAGGGAR